MTSKPMRRPLIKNNEIDLSVLIVTLWSERRLIFISIGVFIVLGFFIAIFSSKEYTTSIKLMPEASQSIDLGTLGGLASQFGLGDFSSAMGGESLSPELYPTIVLSIPFIKGLMDSEVYIANVDSTMTLFHYYENFKSFSLFSAIKKATIKLPYTIIGFFKGERDIPIYGKQESAILYLSYDEWEVYEDLLKRISFDINSKSGIVEVTVKMQDEYLVAMVADKIKDSLLEYLYDYKTERTRTILEFIEDQLKEATSRFEIKQEALAMYRDQNQGVHTQMSQALEQRLQSEYDLAYNIYSAMAQKRGEVELRLQENTPIVKVLQPAFIPKERSSPKRGLIMIMSTILGAFFGVFVVFGREFWIYVKKNFKEVDDGLIHE